MDDLAKLRPWEQRDDESEKAYKGFLAWRDLAGDRTLTWAYRAYIGNKHAGQVPQFFREWRVLHDWTQRSRAWDRYRQDQKDEAQLTAREQAAYQRGRMLAELKYQNTERYFRAGAS